MRVLLLVVLSLIASCDTSERKLLHGHLFFAAGNYVGQFDLRDSSSAAVANLGDVTIDHVSTFMGGDLLLTVRVFDNARETSRILRFNPRTYSSSPLFPGLMAEYLPGTKAVVYDDGLRLLATHRAKAYRDETVIDIHGYNSRPALVVLSNTEILFDSETDGDVVIHHYDVERDESRPLPALSKICVLNGSVWLAGSAQLLCRAQSSSSQTARYVLVSLDGTIRKAPQLPDDKPFRALSYLPDQQIVILTEQSESWGGGQPKYAVWAYDESADESYRIAKDQYLGRSVAYRP